VDACIILAFVDFKICYASELIDTDNCSLPEIPMFDFEVELKLFKLFYRLKYQPFFPWTPQFSRNC